MATRARTKRVSRRTLADYQEHVTHALGKTPDSRITTAEIVNDAGRLLVTMHPWTWRTRPPKSIATVANQQWVALPIDFEELLGDPVIPTGLSYAVIPTTLQDVLLRRQASQFDAFTYYLATDVWQETASPEGEIVRRAEIWPTPSTTTDELFQIAYLAGWVDLVDSTDVPVIPREVEQLLVMMCREIAIHYEDQTEALESVLASRLAQHLMEADGRKQSQLGRMRGGLYDRGRVDTSSVLYPHRRITKA